MIGGVAAGIVACPLYGDHAAWIDPMLPWGKKHEMACHSEVCRQEKAFQKTGTTDDSAHGSSVV